MDPTGHPALERLLAHASDDAEVLAVILFGSRARGDAAPGSDIDVCLLLAPTLDPEEAGSRKRLEYLTEAADLDLTVFQQLPLHVRSRVLKEGRVLFVRDEDALYDVAMRTVRQWEDFRHIHRMYLDEVARG